MANKEWFRQAQYGMMVHFGLYSLLGGEWKGQRMPYIGEWAQAYFRIPKAEYAALAAAFNPIFFDADEWVQTAKDSGMGYLVITSKHHDGFALFRSAADPFNAVDATPFKRDIIEELANACARKGMKLGIYYSQALDWRERDAGGWEASSGLNCGMSWGNTWDFPDNTGKDYTRVFERKIKPQVRELLTNYGELGLIWFDTPHTIQPHQSRELYEMVKKYQPNCLINSRIGIRSYQRDYIQAKEEGRPVPDIPFDYASWGDNELPESVQKSGMLFESPVTLNHTWGYKPFDQDWKSPEEILRIRRHLQKRNINLLLNVGPDPLGRIPAPCVDALLQANGLYRESSGEK